MQNKESAASWAAAAALREALFGNSAAAREWARKALIRAPQFPAALALAGGGDVDHAQAITGRSWAPLLLALSFSVVIALIASLDRPLGSFIKVSQQPLKSARSWMD